MTGSAWGGKGNGALVRRTERREGGGQLAGAGGGQGGEHRAGGSFVGVAGRFDWAPTNGLAASASGLTAFVGIHPYGSA